jgi:hypothetical protein
MSKYHVTISITGKAMVEVVAANAEAARHAVTEMSLSDLALTGRADLLHFKIIPGEITKMVMNEDEGDDDDELPRSQRPSGWYRPRFE